MENKIQEFLKEFNTELENQNRYCNLQYFNNGFVQGISFPEIHLFDDDNDSTEYAEQLSLSRLVKTLSEVLKIANSGLSYHIEEFFKEKKKELKEKFPNAEVKFYGNGELLYNIFVSGDYDYDKMFDALDVVKEDFEYIFDGLKLNFNV